MDPELESYSKDSYESKKNDFKIEWLPVSSPYRQLECKQLMLYTCGWLVIRRHVANEEKEGKGAMA